MPNTTQCIDNKIISYSFGCHHVNVSASSKLEMLHVLQPLFIIGFKNQLLTIRHFALDTHQLVG